MGKCSVQPARTLLIEFKQWLRAFRRLWFRPRREPQCLKGEQSSEPERRIGAVMKSTVLAAAGLPQSLN